MEFVVFAAVAGVVPLGLRASSSGRTIGHASMLTWSAALGVLLAFVLPWRELKLALATPWLLLCAMGALIAARDLWRRRSLALPELALSFGRFYLPVGAGWLLVYLGDFTVAGFSGPKALLTAMHFHYAGFGACTLVGALGRRPSTSALWRRVYPTAARCAIAGVPLLAAGITFGNWLEPVAAGVVMLGMQATAVAMFLRGGWLLKLSAVSAINGSLWALWFSLRGFAALSLGADALLGTMVRWHGLANAIGFVGAGLVALCLEDPV